MAEIKTFNLGKWSDLDEHGHRFCVGMTDAKAAFERLKTHLEINGLLPDEYFRFYTDSSRPNGELPKFKQAVCIPNFGETQGIDLDIWLECQSKSNLPFYVKFATGKMRGETADDYMRMFRIAAECSLMLNGRGASFETKCQDIVLTYEEVNAVAKAVDYAMFRYMESKTEAALSSALDKLKGTTYKEFQAITRYGKDDYSLWPATIPSDLLNFILATGEKQKGTLDELLNGMDFHSRDDMRLITEMQDGIFTFYTIPESLAYLQEYSPEEDSVRGSKEQIIADFFTEWEPAEEPEDELEC